MRSKGWWDRRNRAAMESLYIWRNRCRIREWEWLPINSRKNANFKTRSIASNSNFPLETQASESWKSQARLTKQVRKTTLSNYSRLAKHWSSRVQTWKMHRKCLRITLRGKRGRLRHWKVNWSWERLRMTDTLLETDRLLSLTLIIKLDLRSKNTSTSWKCTKAKLQKTAEKKPDYCRKIPI